MGTLDIQEARDAGYSDEQINEFLLKNPDVKPKQMQSNAAVPAKKSFLRRGVEATVQSPALPIAGGVVGGLAGGGLASIPMAGLGAAGGEGIRQLSARALGLSAPQSSMEALKGIGKQAAIGAVGEGVGQAAVGGLRLGARALAPAGGKVLEALSAATGVKLKGFKDLMEKPMRLLTSSEKSIKVTGEKIGSIIDETISKEMTPDEAAVSLVERAFRTSGANRNAAKRVALKMARGEQVLDSEVAFANRAINVAIGNTTDDGTRALLQGQKQVFQDYLAGHLPDLKTLNSEFSALKSVNAFRSFGRLNKSGETSRLGMMFLLAAAKQPLVFLTSPAVVGTGLAVGSGLAKAATSKPISSTISQIATRGLADALQNRKR